MTLRRALRFVAPVVAPALLAGASAAQWNCDPDNLLAPGTLNLANTYGLVEVTDSDAVFLAWLQDSPSPTVLVQRFDANGIAEVPPASAATLSVGVTGDPRWSSTLGPAGSMALAIATNTGIVVNQINASGFADWGLGQLLPTNPAFSPRLAPFTGGGYALVYVSGGQAQYQVLNAAGAPQFPTAIALGHIENNTALDVVSTGNKVVVAWTSPDGMVVFPLDATGTLFGGALYPQPGISLQGHPALVADSLGGVALAWGELDLLNASTRIPVRRLDAQGSPVVAWETVAIDTEDNFSAMLQPELIANADDSLTVFWPEVGPANSIDLHGQRLASDTTTVWSSPLGNPLITDVNDTAIAARSDGRYVVLTAQGTVALVEPNGSAAIIANTGLPLPADLALTSTDDVIVAAPAGFTRVTSNGDLGGQVPTNYCTAAPSGLGCQPQLQSAGTPTADGSKTFNVIAFGLPSSQPASLVYGTGGRATIPFGDGILCVQPPLKRVAQLYTGGLSTPSCSGGINYDFANFVANAAQTFLNPGVTANMQLVYRDSSNPSGIGSSDGLEFYICP